MCTDGKISFAILLYEYPGRVSHNQQLPLGFYAGDMARKLVISQRNELQAKNIFRIDGKQEDIIQSTGFIVVHEHSFSRLQEL